ncbi:MAG: phosphoribosylanthranilate isomerase [Gemmatimonadota bacterium]
MPRTRKRRRGPFPPHPSAHDLVSETVRPRPRVKICGLTRREDAELAVQLGADLVGFVLTRGFGRSVAESDADALTHGLSAERVAVLVDEPVARAVALAGSIDARVVQLHGSESPETVQAVREAGGWRVWKAVRARTLEDVAQAVLHYGSLVDGMLVEGWREGVLGGGGAKLAVAPATLRTVLPEGLEFVLAGGLTADSVAAAIEDFRPDVVDVSSGVEGRPGRKDAAAMRRFVAAAKDPWKGSRL